MSEYVTLRAASDDTEFFFHYSAVVLVYQDNFPSVVTIVVLRAGQENIDMKTHASVTEVRAAVEAASKSAAEGFLIG